MSKETRTTSSSGGQKGVKIERYDLIPVGPLRELAQHYGRGARKYADNQWRKGYEWSKSIAALQRHFEDFRDGKDYDVCSNDPEGCYGDEVPEWWDESIAEPDTCPNHTGSHHMAAVAWHSFLLLEFKDVHPQHDDRWKGLLDIEDAEEVDEITSWAGDLLLRRDAVSSPFPKVDISEFVDKSDDEHGRLLAEVLEPSPFTRMLREFFVAYEASCMPTRFVVGLEGDTEDLDPLGFLQEYYNPRD